MTTRMLIDARHSEETRVAVLQGNRIEEFDFESAEHKQIKGNIYLAKVTRVEPSLQAAFVDFGGNRHGFLAFSEIHPDYYQIPKQDREALIAEEAEQAAEEEALRASEDGDDDYGGDDLDEGSGGVTEIDTSEKDQVATIEAGHVDNGFAYADEDGDGAPGHDDERGEDRADGHVDAQDDAHPDDGHEQDGQPRNRDRRQGQGRARSKAADDLRDRRMALRRRYKIQDVIQRRQVLLVQVVKEERGNKGAALTTYLSLAGRYCVLMPNSSHGGGISRKISSAADRKRLKAIVGELELPRGMGCIVRTAGLARTKPEIKRDFDYLARLWDTIRENTLKSSAPALIHSDSDLIKRAIRDIYNRDIEEVVVEGEEGYHAARAFMKLLMPSHVRRVKPYVDAVPLFQRHGAEDQLTAMYDPVVQLRSGGYIVINPTEALVSIDINSGRSTKEYGIEATALNTNLEAAREIARQLRLRDMAGLVVIDFIDMEHSSNVRKVEKAMKDALKNDRARIQVGRISGFGLMEMSRQRLRTGVLEATTRMCPHCDGSGLVRTASSAGLSALRMIEDEAAKGRGTVISLFASAEASIYLLNAKRADLGEIETLYGVRVEVLPEGENEGAKMRVVSSGPRPETMPHFAPIIEHDAALEDELEEDEFDEADEDLPEDETRPEERSDEGRADEARADDGDGRRKRRKRRRGRGRDRADEPALDEVAGVEGDEADGGAANDDDDIAGESEAGEAIAEDGDGLPKRRRSRGRRRRGGRGRSDEASEGEEGRTDVAGSDVAGEAPADSVGSNDDLSDDSELDVAASEEDGSDYALATGLSDEQPLEPESTGSADEATVPAEPERKPRGRRKAAAAAEDGGDVAVKLPRARRRKADAEPADVVPELELVPVPEESAEPKLKRPRRKKVDSDAEASAPDALPTDVPLPMDPPMVPSQAETDEAETVELVEIAPATMAANADDADYQDVPSGSASPDDAAQDDPQDTGSPRRGWWQRTFGT